MKRPMFGVACVLLTMALAVGGSSTTSLANPAEEQPAPVFRFNDERPVRAVVCEGKTVLDIPPLRGIGKAKIQLVEGRWPKRLVLRTRAPALEGFGKKTPYDDVKKRRVGDALEIEIPAAWYAQEPRAIDITWVDYFR